MEIIIMDEQQFNLLIQKLQICKNERIEKLDEIRCCTIDVEEVIKKKKIIEILN